MDCKRCGKSCVKRGCPPRLSLFHWNRNLSFERENIENQFARNYTAFSSRFRFNGKEWEGRALRNRPVAYFSEEARLPRGQGEFLFTHLSLSGARWGALLQS